MIQDTGTFSWEGPFFISSALRHASHHWSLDICCSYIYIKKHLIYFTEYCRIDCERYKKGILITHLCQVKKSQAVLFILLKYQSSHNLICVSAGSEYLQYCIMLVILHDELRCNFILADSVSTSSGSSE